MTGRHGYWGSLARTTERIPGGGCDNGRWKKNNMGLERRSVDWRRGVQMVEKRIVRFVENNITGDIDLASVLIKENGTSMVSTDP